MASRKSTKKYYFSVEGQTEQWYFNWLSNEINNNEKSTHKVSFDIKVEKDPLKRAKKLMITQKTIIFHISDYESNEEFHENQFKKTMDSMKKASNLGKQITYRFGYSNFTFDLWILLHKIDCSGTLSHRNNYLSFINRAFGEKFSSMNDYKHENNFKKCLAQLTIEDVRNAIQRSKDIMTQNLKKGYILQEYRGYTYYRENPSLSVWEVVERILNDCNLLV